MKAAIAAQWGALERHFEHHARVVEHFREVGTDDVVRMWQRQTNEGGGRLSQFEREALKERHCELLGLHTLSRADHFGCLGPSARRRRGAPELAKHAPIIGRRSIHSHNVTYGNRRQVALQEPTCRVPSPTSQMGHLRTHAPQQAATARKGQSPFAERDLWSSRRRG
jgi:hypothetical protein